tara:strand:- start:606 stop:1487 length:882 start_codon:yes stop_codon:yes gene_type:complete
MLAGATLACLALVCPWRKEWPVPKWHKQQASQCGQDAFLDHNIFRGALNGTYLDLGCNDGRSNSNTYWFAHNAKRNWYGKCYEADPKMFSQIRSMSGRTDGEHGAISNKDGVATFGVVNVRDGGLSGLMNTLDTVRGKRFGKIRTVDAPTVTPRTILERHYASIETIDYVSLDVEGHELEVMRAWPFHARWCISVFTIENNHWCNASHGILEELKHLMPQYVHLTSIGVDEVFVRKVSCANTKLTYPGTPVRTPSRRFRNGRSDLSPSTARRGRSARRTRPDGGAGGASSPGS